MDLNEELTLLRDFGFTHLDVQVKPNVVTGGPARPAAGEDARHHTGSEGGDDVALLDDLRAVALACTKCKLAKTRTNVVYGVGNPNADVMFVGEGPGRDEDQQGEPFVGRAGQLLTDIIKAMQLTREQVYIANIVKCRPPENRDPEPDEVEACRPFIRRQIELIKPKVIVTLGRIALQSLTEKAYGITSVRGQWLDYEGIKLMPTYHPAYLLRNLPDKAKSWEDLIFARRTLAG